MALFWRLLLAHLLADFPLQTDAVFAAKKEKRWGVLLHGTLFGLVAILLVKPFLGIGAIWGGLILLWLFHVAVDKAKLIAVSGGRGDHLVYFLSDQILHIGALALASYVLNQNPQVAAIVQGPVSEVHLIKLGIAYVVSIWASPLLSFYLEAAFSPQKMGFAAHQPPLWRILGYVERGMLTAIVAWGGALFFLIPIAFLPRVSIWFFAGERNFSRWEFILGSAMAVLAGAWASTLG
jgi:hypothetical protein